MIKLKHIKKSPPSDKKFKRSQSYHNGQIDFQRFFDVFTTSNKKRWNFVVYYFSYVF